MGVFLIVIYLVAGFWATKKTIYANKVVIYSNPTAFFYQRLVFALFLGWILIPVALLKTLAGR